MPVSINTDMPWTLLPLTIIQTIEEILCNEMVSDFGAQGKGFFRFHTYEIYLQNVPKEYLRFFKKDFQFIECNVIGFWKFFLKKGTQNQLSFAAKYVGDHMEDWNEQINIAKENHKITDPDLFSMDLEGFLNKLKSKIKKRNKKRKIDDDAPVEMNGSTLDLDDFLENLKKRLKKRIKKKK